MDYGKIKQVSKGDKILMKYNNKIIGFIQEIKRNKKVGSLWGYAFGKPSQSSYIMFYEDTKENAIKYFLESVVI